MRQIRYSQSLLNFLNGYVNKNEKEVQSKRYKFTGGVIYLEDGLVATDRRLLVKVEIPDVPKEMKNKVYDIDDNLVTDDVDNMSILLSLNQSRPNSFNVDGDKWEERYNEVKKHKSKNVRNTIKLCDGLVVVIFFLCSTSSRDTLCSSVVMFNVSACNSSVSLGAVTSRRISYIVCRE